MLYVITLKEFNHTKCEALDLKSQAHVQGLSKIKLQPYNYHHIPVKSISLYDISIVCLC